MVFSLDSCMSISFLALRICAFRFCSCRRSLYLPCILSSIFSPDFSSSTSICSNFSTALFSFLTFFVSELSCLGGASSLSHTQVQPSGAPSCKLGEIEGDLLPDPATSCKKETLVERRRCSSRFLCMFSFAFFSVFAQYPLCSFSVWFEMLSAYGTSGLALAVRNSSRPLSYSCLAIFTLRSPSSSLRFCILTSNLSSDSLPKTIFDISFFF